MSRKRIRDIRHDELIAATIAAVHSKGYAAVTMAEIAAEAGATAASINYYFGSKDRLMEATMRHLLELLRQATLRRLAVAEGPQARLLAVVEANFDDSLFQPAQCSIWVQFWANAPYSALLARLHHINRQRVRSHFQAELRALVPGAQRETLRLALQHYMDGIWLQAAQSDAPLLPDVVRAEARRVALLLLESAALSSSSKARAQSPT
ncbi:transcriptional regulator BetI [Cognatishimia sp. SS12]|uniref:choline-binding transcriptional repressor BetI n=1 Tax=Cognatishimia sp. SS12 TaxID=2979465 RepID=UPI002330FA5C|nr:transcriptional regulator BetI [Cognatishimia sp. SS12]MDC0738603.1 transcriptional regulator BetI [Cognatishimia sp. SS12]